MIDAGRDSVVSFLTECGVTSGDAPQVFTRNRVTVLGNGTATDTAQVKFRGGTVDFSENDITTDRGFLLIPWSTVGGNITGNTFVLGAQGFYVYGTSTSVISMNGGNHQSTEDLSDSGGYGLSASIHSLTVSGDNLFTNTGPASGTAVRLISAQNALVAVDLNDAVFEGFKNAFYFSLPSGFMGFEVNAHHNNFNFPITAAPQVAQLEGINAQDTINLDENRWGENTSTATVRSFIAPSPALVKLDSVKSLWP